MGVVVSIPHVCLMLNVNVMVGTTGQAPPIYFNSETFYTLTFESFEYEILEEEVHMFKNQLLL